MSKEQTLSTVVERHHPEMPRYVVVPDQLVSDWKLEKTTTVEGTVNGQSIGRRSLKRFDASRWFIDLPESLCRRTGITTGSTIELLLRLASTDLPAELSELLRSSEGAAAWKRLSPSQQRTVREHVLAAKQSETRLRRSRRSLGLPSQDDA